MATIINETAIKTMVRMISGVLTFEDFSIKIDNHHTKFIDLTVKSDLAEAWLNVSLVEWRHGCHCAHDYLENNGYVLANIPTHFVPGGSIDAKFYSSVILFVFEVIYYYRLGPDTFRSLQLTLGKVLFPIILEKASRLARRVPLVFEM